MHVSSCKLIKRGVTRNLNENPLFYYAQVLTLVYMYMCVLDSTWECV